MVSYTSFEQVLSPTPTAQKQADQKITQGLTNNPSVVNTILRERAFTDSFKKEKAGLEVALTWIKNNTNNIDNTVLTCTRSNSLCKTILAKNLCQ